MMNPYESPLIVEATNQHWQALENVALSITASVSVSIGAVVFYASIHNKASELPHWMPFLNMAVWVMAVAVSQFARRQLDRQTAEVME